MISSRGVNKTLARWAKRVAGAAGVRARRSGPENRFDAMEDSLRLLRDAGYGPRIVIDGGANVGRWTAMAARVFPDAQFHLIEPQPGCQPHLTNLDVPRREIHPVVVTRPGVSSVRLASIGHEGVGTGAFATPAAATFGPEMHVAEYPATTLDALFANRVTGADRVLFPSQSNGTITAHSSCRLSIFPKPTRSRTTRMKSPRVPRTVC